MGAHASVLLGIVLVLTANLNPSWAAPGQLSRGVALDLLRKEFDSRVAAGIEAAFRRSERGEITGTIQLSTWQPFGPSPQTLDSIDPVSATWSDLQRRLPPQALLDRGGVYGWYMRLRCLAARRLISILATSPGRSPYGEALDIKFRLESSFQKLIVDAGMETGLGKTKPLFLIGRQSIVELSGPLDFTDVVGNRATGHFVWRYAEITPAYRCQLWENQASGVGRHSVPKIFSLATWNTPTAVRYSGEAFFHLDGPTWRAIGNYSEGGKDWPYPPTFEIVRK